MCPDNQLISAYFDDELDSKWSEQVESHISSCRECSRKLEAYRQLSAVLESGVISEEQELKVRVLGEIQRRHAVYSSDVFWRRHLNVSGARADGSRRAYRYFLCRTSVRFYSHDGRTG